MKVTFIALVMFMFSSAYAADIHMDVYSAKTSNVNAFVFSDSKGSLIVDSTRSSKEGVEVAKLAKKVGEPKIIFITHGHPDHFLGMGALKKEFPNAKVMVANEQIKNDIIGFAKFMEENHWLDEEPSMKPKTEKNPSGFDYQQIEVLNGNMLVLPGGAKIDVITKFPKTEAEHETVLYSKDLNALFASDLAYNGVHLWMGQGVDSLAIKNWKSELKKLSAEYNPKKSKIYPGHGEPTDTNVFDMDIKYMNDLVETVKRSKTQDDAKAAMIKKYPHWENADFLLTMSLKNQFKLLKK